ncbi:glycosyltransferase family 2 protein [Haloimpatiens lingqiaonensis]|uniref:glycosyltransferase family 2 protein n=1 Tax=Haloimpatiens lingqiaonensis TaxID=1380675 RepID=UPI0010FE099A|nr:glycosyltransferase family 2 protein [Haloimpatiens lingqiaonensis]
MNECKVETVSVVIPCKNESEYIEECLQSFINQSYSKELYEVLVCDGMSTDGTPKIVKEYEKKYKNVRLIENYGITAPKGMNIGIKNSKAHVVIIFGAHAYADRDFIKNNIELLNKNKDVGCAGGPIETINFSHKGRGIALAMSSPFGVGNALFRYAKEEMYVDTVAFGAYKRSVLDKIGYFDDELVRNQDDEINYRVIKNGYKILLSPRVKSYYYSRDSLKKLWRQYFQYGFWKVKVMQKHGKTASIRHLVPMSFVLTNILGILFGFFFRSIRILWLIEVVAYILFDIIFSIKVTKKETKTLKYVPIIFPILHISYGLGFLEGLNAFYIFKSKNSMEKNKELSR